MSSQTYAGGDTFVARDSVDVPTVGADVTFGGRIARQIYVGTGGNLRVRRPTGTIANYLNVPGGFYVPGEVEAIIAAGTTAWNLVAEW